MAYKSELEQVCQEIEEAKGAIVRAHRSGKIPAINKAERRLGDLHAEYRECAGGLRPDDR